MTYPPKDNPELVARLAAATMPVSALRRNEIHDAYSHLATMLAHIPRDLDFGDEPANTFDSQAAAQQSFKE